MRVAHRHLHVGMAGQGPGFRNRCTASEKCRDVAVPAAGVEISDSLFRFVGNANSLQVLLHHEPSLLPLQLGKQPTGSLEASEPQGKHFDKTRMKRQHVLAAML